MKTPEDMVVALVDAGWRLVGGREGVYARLQVVDSLYPRQQLSVPLDRSAPDFEEMWGAVIRHLERTSSDGRAAQKALDRFYAKEAKA